MIIRQNTTIVFEYPQDYLQEQEWCKTKEDRWIHKSTDTLGAVYENTISYSIGQPSNSEKPNNCECEPRKEQNFCGKCRYLYRDFKYGLSCYRLMDNEPCKYEERKDEPTISKMEQVDEPQLTPNYCGTCRHRDVPCGDLPCDVCHGYSNYAPQDEPQTEQVGVPFGLMDEATFKSHCLNCQRDIADIKCLDCDGDKYFVADEPQTDLLVKTPRKSRDSHEIAKDEPTKTLAYCDRCNHKGCENCIADNSNPYCVPSNYEPQTDCPWK